MSFYFENKPIHIKEQIYETVGLDHRLVSFFESGPTLQNESELLLCFKDEENRLFASVVTISERKELKEVIPMVIQKLFNALKMVNKKCQNETP